MIKFQSFKLSVASSAILLALSLCSVGAEASLAAVNQSPQDLDEIETKLLERSYPKEVEDQRLGRLEEFVFGEKRTGSLESRLTNLEKAIKSPEGIPAPAPTSGQAPLKHATATPSGAGGNAAKPSATTNGAPAFPSYDYGKYPRVAELEREWLGKTFETDSLQQRVERLETRMLGKTSPPGEDLCDRIDRLDEFSQKMVPTDVAGTSENRHYASYNQLGLTQAPVADAQETPKKNPFAPGNEPPPSSVFQRTSVMERLVFGHEHGGHPLAERVHRLEKKLVPYEVSKLASEDLTKRISNLWTMLEAANNEPQR